MDPTDIVDVVVVGAGPVGLTLAVDLARRGVDVRVLERSPRPNRASKAKAVQSRSLEVLDDLGAVEDVLRIGVAELPVRYHTVSGAVLDRPSLTVPARAGFHTPYPYPRWIAQFDVEQALRDRLGELGVLVEFGREVVGVTQDDTAATITLRCGETVRAGWVAATDGGKSTVRDLLGLHLDGTTYDDERWYFGDVTTADLDRQHMHIWPSDAGMLILTPLPGTDVFQLQSPIAHGAAAAEPGLPLFQRLLDERDAGVRVVAAPWASVFRANVRELADYRHGRVLFAGDAAHVHSPAGGQGMNTGIQDAYNLGWKLGAVVAGTRPELLDTYSAERVPVARRVLAMSAAKLADTTASADQDTDALSAALSRLSDDAITTGLGIRYHPTTTTSGADAASGPAVGERAPDAGGLIGPGFTGDVFDLLRGPHWTVLAFDSDVGPAVDGVDPEQVRLFHIGADAGAGILDAGGQFRAIYAPVPGELILIRPDGYLAARCFRPAGVSLHDLVIETVTDREERP